LEAITGLGLGQAELNGAELSTTPVGERSSDTVVVEDIPGVAIERIRRAHRGERARWGTKRNRQTARGARYYKPKPYFHIIAN
jgi:hypothetical protein